MVGQMRAHWQALPPPRQRLLAAGWVMVLLMAVYVAGRPLINGWQESQRWRSLAGQASMLPVAQRLTADDWGSLASATGLVLTEVSQEGAAWRLSGRMERSDALGSFIDRAMTRGWHTQRWHIGKDTEGLVFELDLQGYGEGTPR